MKITVSAPGKIILMGEHSVVYGKPALISAVDRRVQVSLTDGKRQTANGKRHYEIAKLKNEIKLIDKNLTISETTSLDKIVEFTKWARGEWEEFNKTKDSSFLKQITKDPLALIKIAIGEMFCHEEVASPSGARLAMTRENITLEINSGIPIGRGMGSSAAVSVAVVGAVYAYLKSLTNFEEAQSDSSKFKVNFDKEDLEMIYEIALEVEKRVHGNPSGADTGIATYGGFLRYQKKDEDLRIVQPINLEKQFLDNFTVIDTGKPVETTGEMVEIVRRKIIAQPRWGREMLGKMEEGTKEFYEGIGVAFAESFGGPREGEGFEGKKIREAIFSYERCLEKLGVVSEAAKQFIRALRENGVAAKISGAGGGKEGSGMVIGYGEKKITFDIAKRLGMEVIPVEFGGEGLRINCVIR